MADLKKIIIFDLDGTLVDSQLAHARSFNLAFKKNKLEEQPDNFVITKFGPTAELVIKSIFPELDAEKLKQIAIDKRNFFVDDTCKLTKPIEGVSEALQELKKDFLLALVSNATHAEIEAILKTVGIKQKLFSAIFGYGETHAKPDPDIIDAVEKKVKGRAEYFVGDTIYDIRTGNLAEIKTIAVLTGVHTVEQLGKENPTIIIESVALLPEYFGGDL
ncbi:MAG TPA: HAD family hydrolase [Candidatus Nanoarchaeia archaeon]|nr:HAD family hydrolase [Candidatus Nanoarchaeia archaeon]